MTRLLDVVVRLAVCCAVLVVGCQRTDPAATHATTQPATRPTTSAQATDLPMLVIDRMPNNVPSPTNVSGVVAAVWSDGRVLRASSASGLVQPYVTGTAQPSDMRVLRRMLADARAAPPLPPYRAVPDSGAVSIIVRDGDRASTYVEPPYDGGDSLAARLRDFIYAMTLTDQQPTDFSGGAPPGWLETR